MQALETLLNDHDYAHAAICGDWNTDPSRNNAQSELFYTFTDRNGLEICWNHPISKCDYTYVTNGSQHRSCIDHFLQCCARFSEYYGMLCV